MADEPDTEVINDNAPEDNEGPDQSEQEYTTLEDLLRLSSEDAPEFGDDANHKGMKPLSEWLEHVPEDVRKHLANIRSDYTRKTQALAEERNRLKAELEQERERLRTERAALYQGKMAEQIGELSSSEEEFDMFDPEGMKKEIQRQAAKMLKDMIEPAREELAIEQRKIELERFTSEHPEIKTDEYRMPVAELLQARPELRLEDAYYIVKAKLDAATAQESRVRQKEAFGKISSGTAGQPQGAPKYKGPDAAWKYYQYHKSQQGK